MDRLERVKKEIERLKQEANSKRFGNQFQSGRESICCEILSFINSMQEELVSEQNLSNVERTGKNWKEEPVSEDLLIAARRAAVDKPDTPLEFLDERPYSPRDEYKFIEGANWQKEQFEKNRLKHCDSITKEQAELEQGFIDQHLDKHHRMPTFLDAIEYGIQWQKELKMKTSNYLKEEKI